MAEVPEWIQIIDSDSLGRSETSDLTARVNRLLVDPGYTEDEIIVNTSLGSETIFV